jgi:hypothetical protein
MVPEGFAWVLAISATFLEISFVVSAILPMK